MGYFIVKRRLLTEGEKQLARSVFSDQLDLSQITIVAHRWVLKDYGISPNGHVYFNPHDWCEDFSSRSLAQQSWLIHELTHVWQVQQGIWVWLRALLNRQYQYVLIDGKKFANYGVEQQAQMVQDYFVRRAKGQACCAYEGCIPFLAQNQRHSV